eukprot:6470148-Amphidinium_carterae.1
MLHVGHSHLACSTDVKEYNTWHKTEPVELFKAPVKKKFDAEAVTFVMSVQKACTLNQVFCRFRVTSSVGSGCESSRLRMAAVRQGTFWLVQSFRSVIATLTAMDPISWVKIHCCRRLNPNLDEKVELSVHFHVQLY